mmetsp:Transcript_93315/g.263913  ORF Transcript_93315/g.263913 Transcript_93315/m.263913 type:complete len:230 (+) Transcript_93315:351-1040(+)
MYTVRAASAALPLLEGSAYLKNASLRVNTHANDARPSPTAASAGSRAPQPCREERGAVHAMAREGRQVVPAIRSGRRAPPAHARARRGSYASASRPRARRRACWAMLRTKSSSSSLSSQHALPKFGRAASTPSSAGRPRPLCRRRPASSVSSSLPASLSEDTCQECGSVVLISPSSSELVRLSAANVSKSMMASALNFVAMAPSRWLRAGNVPNIPRCNGRISARTRKA